MKKILIALTLGCMIVSVFFFNWNPTYAYETTALTPRIEVLLPGVSQSYTITQHQDFPQDFSIFTVFLIGHGFVSISLSLEEGVASVDQMVISGVGISAAGIIPFFRFGRGDVGIDVGIEIGNEQFPYGMLQFSSWITRSVDEQGNTYTIDLSF
jgi:hypothetical protein